MTPSRSTPDPIYAGPPSGLFSGTPIGLLASLVVALVGCAALVDASWLPPATVRVTTIAVAHGGLIAMAFAWAATTPPLWRPLVPSVITMLILAVAAAAAAWDARAAILYLASPLWLAFLTARGRLTPLGVRWEMPAAGAVVLGLAAGLALGGHMLFAAAGTFGHRVRSDSLVLAAMAYDAGANVPSSELFFRGALFNRLQRRWSFAAAVIVATAVALVRYLVDPLLPRAPEVIVGTLLYLTLLGVINAWLLWWSGSLMPGIVASFVFFAAYRMVAAV